MRARVPHVCVCVHMCMLTPRCLASTRTPHASGRFPSRLLPARHRALCKEFQAKITATRQQLQQDQASSPPLSSSSSSPSTILERMLVQRDERGQGLSDDEVVDNLITMFFAGGWVGG